MRILTEQGPKEYRAVWMEGDKVVMIDQRLIPEHFRSVRLSLVEDVAKAIKDMTVRGAPAIGVAAAYGMALAAINGQDLESSARLLKAQRPTAFDLFFAVDHMLGQLCEGVEPVIAANEYADSIVEKCRHIGERGQELIADGDKVMTHCNAGALATVDYGTALAPIRVAWRAGKRFFVYVSETRPRLQGMRLTAYELRNEGIPHSIIVDGASGHFMRKDVDLVIVGADRIAANGDFANKIGTFEKAVLAKELGIPFYVAAPASTFDFSLESGKSIVIEDRDEDEVTFIDGKRIAPEGSGALNPSFDMTPSKYVRGFITEVGILSPKEIAKVKGARK
ncbi:MAG TPA: S-methyl-5-thioribose-1-phosphate isomerase [Methanomassiliicoccales archaeon]|nr:S-methyl-5-thioribose-1-phosphate isomerase [Methanomassiliicoccales archaeon]